MNLTGATYPTRNNVPAPKKAPARQGAGKRKGPQQMPKGDHLYRHFDDCSPDGAPWVWNPRLSGPPRRSSLAGIHRYDGPPIRQTADYRPPTGEKDFNDVRSTVKSWASRGGDTVGRTRRGATPDTTAETLDPQATMTGAQTNPNLLHTLKTGDLKSYAFKCPPGMDPNNSTVPGVYLPNVMRSSQALWGTATNKCGTAEKLAYIAKSVPTDWAPRFLTADAISTSSSVFSNFRKTRYTFAENRDPDRYVTSVERQFEPPPVGWECAACQPPNPHVKPYGRYKRALEAADRNIEIDRLFSVDKYNARDGTARRRSRPMTNLY